MSNKNVCTPETKMLHVNYASKKKSINGLGVYPNIYARVPAHTPFYTNGPRKCINCDCFRVSAFLLFP